MDAGVIVAIVLASVAIILVLGFLLYYYAKRNRLEAGSSGLKYSQAYQKAYATAYQSANVHPSL